MPEGDTLYRIANRLRPILTGEAIVNARANPPRTGAMINAESLVGHVVETVEAVGKHLLIAFDDERVLHSHLGMTGSWHIYTPDQPWLKPAHRAGVVLATEKHFAVNFSPKFLELVTERAIRRNSYLLRLGPDLMRATTDVARVLPRIRAHNRTPVGVAVMNQTIAAGIGNIYKSESLFLARLNPWTLVGELSDQQLLDYFALAQNLMRNNRHGGERTTRVAAGGPLLWVYGRRGQPCLECGSVILLRRQGDQGRTTYWCPQCQTPPAAEGHTTRSADRNDSTGRADQDSAVRRT